MNLHKKIGNICNFMIFFCKLILLIPSSDSALKKPSLALAASPDP